ncbi:Defensin [Carabus blaptoides fortunei]
MYKISFVILMVAVFCSAIPANFEVTEEPQQVEERANRQRRVTCDLLSGSVAGVSLGHSACAAHCLAMGRGFRGGRCIDGVCNCRK